MEKLYTAVGCLQFQGRRSGKRYPLVKLNGKEYLLDMQEMMLWSILNWRIVSMDELCALYGDENIPIDVAAVDQQNKRLFVGECKYHKSPVDADVYFDLKKKTEQSKKLTQAFAGYKIIYGVFSKSGFKERLLDLNRGNPDLILINETQIV